MTLQTFLILSLAVYRITHLIVFDKIFDPIRNIFVTRNFKAPIPTYTLQGGIVRRIIGKIMNCYWCSGIWVAAVIVFGFYGFTDIKTSLLLTFALAAIQSLIETAWAKEVGFPEMEEAPAVTEDNPAGVFRGLGYGILFTVVIGAAIIGSWYFAEIILGGK